MSDLSFQPEPTAGKTRPTLDSAEYASPSPFAYRDYRVFLKDWFSWKKATMPQFSGAMFARKAGLGSHTLLGMVIRGERNLSYKTIRAFIKAMGLRTKEAGYFERLVLFCQAQDSDEKTFQLQQLQMLAQGPGREILTRLQDHAKFLSHWYVVAIYTMVMTEGFKNDPEWIAQRLKRKITRKQAAEAVELLLKLELIQIDESSAVKVSANKIDLDPGAVDFAIRNFHKEYLNRSLDAVDGESLNERELSSLTLSIDAAEWPRLRERIKEFRLQLNNEFSNSETKKNTVVAVNMQSIVLTELNSNEREILK